MVLFINTGGNVFIRYPIFTPISIIEKNIRDLGHNPAFHVSNSSIDENVVPYL
jgi:hypothetical protein